MFQSGRRNRGGALWAVLGGRTERHPGIIPNSLHGAWHLAGPQQVLLGEEKRSTWVLRHQRVVVGC